MIACDNDDKDLVLGYICCEPGLLHFAYTKSTYRQQGIMRRLLKESGFKYGDVIKCTHWSDCWEQIIAQRYKVQYTPSELKLRSHNDD